MKKYFLVSTVAFLTLSLAAYAQTRPSAPKPAPAPRPAPAPAPRPVPAPAPRPVPAPAPRPVPAPAPRPVPAPAPRPAPQHPAPPVTVSHRPTTTIPTLPANRPVVAPPKPRAGNTAVVNPSAHVNEVAPPHVATFSQPSERQDPRSSLNITAAQTRFTSFKTRNADIAARVDSVRTQFQSQYGAAINTRADTITRFYDNNQYRYYYSPFFSSGFYGGFFYPVRPIVDIDAYFYYPCVNWFYVPVVDVDFYTTWYGDDVYPDYPVDPCPYADVYFPTDTFNDLGLEVSYFSPPKQRNFRNGFVNMTDRLRVLISANLNGDVQFNDNDLTINYYANLKDQAYEVAGFYDNSGIDIPFEGFIDVTNPSETLVFVPSGQNPTDADQQNLTAINAHITGLGGNPYEADEEPQ